MTHYVTYDALLSLALTPGNPLSRSGAKCYAGVSGGGRGVRSASVAQW